MICTGYGDLRGLMLYEEVVPLSVHCNMYCTGYGELRGLMLYEEVAPVSVHCNMYRVR